MVQHATTTEVLAPHYDARTTSSLIFDLFEVRGDVDAALETYRARRAAPLLGEGVSTGANIFRLREQQVPAAPLARGVTSGLDSSYHPRLMLFQDEKGPERDLPDAVFGAAYQLASDDLDTALASIRPAGDGIRSISLGAYSKIIDFGRPDPVGDDAVGSAMIVFTHPTDLGYAHEFNRWYSENHMIDAAKSPPYRSASRYVLREFAEGTPLPYLCIYEIEAPYSAQVHRDMMNQISVLPWPPREPNPSTPAGQPVLQIDFWGYYERVWSGAPGR